MDFLPLCARALKPAMRPGDSLKDTLIAKGIELDGLSEGIDSLEEVLITRSWS
jgi:hypothetical protein